MDKRMQRAKINALTTSLSQIVSTLIGIAIPWIMIANFGSEAYGATTSIASFLAYISLFEGGIGRVARSALYKPLADGDEEQISSIYLAVKRFLVTRFLKLNLCCNNNCGYKILWPAKCLHKQVRLCQNSFCQGHKQ